MNPNEGAPNKKTALDAFRERFGNREYAELFISLKDNNPDFCPNEFWKIDIPHIDENDNCEISCVECWHRAIPEEKHTVTLEALKEVGEAAKKASESISNLAGVIKDSGDRTEFETGAVRDMREGKGRCDLMPLEVVAQMIHERDNTNLVLAHIANFKTFGDTTYLYMALENCGMFSDLQTMFLEVAKHFEEGAKKYGENNWQKGIPVYCYIDSAVRHYLKWLRGDTDEPHDRAFVWNLMCCIWEVDYREKSND